MEKMSAKFLRVSTRKMRWSFIVFLFYNFYFDGNVLLILYENFLRHEMNFPNFILIFLHSSNRFPTFFKTRLQTIYSKGYGE